MLGSTRKGRPRAFGPGDADLGWKGFSFQFGIGPAAALLFLCCLTPLRADTITIGGVINQSTQDGTGPAVNNPNLNNIMDGDLYTFELSFLGSITSPGTYDLAGLSVLFTVAVPGVDESNFSSGSLTVGQSGGLDQIIILACLGTGSGCNQGNELDLSFSIQQTQLNSANATPQGIATLLPFDLLEDDGVTDIHATVTSYSYGPPSAVPEPSAAAMLALGCIALAVNAGIRRYNSRLHR